MLPRRPRCGMFPRRAWCSRKEERSTSMSAGRMRFSAPTGLIFPADVQSSNYLAKQIAVIYDSDGSITDLLLGNGASDPSGLPAEWRHRERRLDRSGGLHPTCDSDSEWPLHGPGAPTADAAAISADAGVRPCSWAGVVADQRQRLHAQPAADVRTRRCTGRSCIRSISSAARIRICACRSRSRCVRMIFQRSAQLYSINQGQAPPGQDGHAAERKSGLRGLLFPTAAGDARRQCRGRRWEQFTHASDIEDWYTASVGLGSALPPVQRQPGYGSGYVVDGKRRDRRIHRMKGYFNLCSACRCFLVPGS